MPERGSWAQDVRNLHSPSSKEAREKKLLIPESEYEWQAIRARGAGGQKVNKTSIAMRLSWSLEASRILSPEQKALLRTRLNLTKSGTLEIRCENERSQAQNKATCIERLHEIIWEALREEIPRVATKPTRGSQERRIEGKKRDAQTKQARQAPRNERY